MTCTPLLQNLKGCYLCMILFNRLKRAQYLILREIQNALSPLPVIDARGKLRERLWIGWP